MNVSLNFMLTLSRFKRFKKTQQLKFSKQQLPDPGFGQILRFQRDSGYFEVSCHIKQGFGEKRKKTYVNMYVCVHVQNWYIYKAMFRIISWVRGTV